MDRVPIFPLGLVLLPRMPLPLHIFETRYRDMAEHCLATDRPFGVVLHTGSTVQTIGCLAAIENVITRYDDGRLDILTSGTERFRIHNLHDDKPYLEAEITIIHDHPTSGADYERVRELAQLAVAELWKYAKASGYTLERTVIEQLNDEELSFLLATTDVFGIAEKQSLLELQCTATRMERARKALDDSRRKRKMVQGVREFLGKRDDEDISFFFN